MVVFDAPAHFLVGVGLATQAVDLRPAGATGGLTIF